MTRHKYNFLIVAVLGVTLGVLFRVIISYSRLFLIIYDFFSLLHPSL